MENETEETQEPNDGVSTPEDIETIKAQLEEEKKAKAAAEAALVGKDARIAELQAELSQVLTLSETKGKELESTTAELSQLKEVHAQAVVRYLDAVRLANPTIPQDIIAGQTIEEIEASVEKALSIASAVKASLEAQAKEARVPAGAPARGEISLEGLTPREKIAAGIQQGSQR
jgi:chromosome segregation ATPase